MVPVCAAVILKSGMVLLCRRGPGRRHAGLWEFPGGRVEPGETHQAALKRELMEELGIDATVGEEAGRNVHADPWAKIELVAFFVKSYAGTPQLRDHDAFKWVESRRLLEYELSPADIPIAAALAAHRRRDRYTGTHPKEFGQKYKELAGDAEAARKAKERGSTPAGAHVSIMVKEALAALGPLSGSRVLDCTLGWGGHAEALARAGASVTGLDRDGEELSRTKARLAALGLPLETRHTDYAAAASLGLPPFDAVFADLGVSSMQLDRPERGMSFKADGPLDMRMDRSRGPTAAEWIEAASPEQVEEALRLYGNEPNAAAVARALKARLPKTTAELSSAVGIAKGLGPGPFKKKDASAKHPAVRVFQALRIAVNDERASLERFLASLPGLLKPGGRAAFLTFHSGEERLVEAALRAQAAKGLWTAPPAAPLRASPEETRENPRARSARLWRSIRA
jgi:16S rRNA (cytosine1402-N4)-methyltransferase